MKFFNDRIKIEGIKKNTFDLSHEKKLSLNVGKLIPIMCQDVIPGDSVSAKSEIFLRMAPMLAPIMHRVDVYTHYFFVPNRLMWDEWNDFITGGESGLLEPVFPTLRVTDNVGSVINQFGVGSLADYLGLGYVSDIVAAPTNPIDISALPFRAYQMIYNEYYRDQNLEPAIEVVKTGGDMTLNDTLNGTTFVANLLELRRRAWEKDYFTTALPWPARGAEAFAPIDTFIGQDGQVPDAGPASFDASGHLISVQPDVTTGQLLINELRKANALQQWLEKQARGGGRLFETILSHFGVKISDARVQRPEYLGGGSNPVRISEVLSTFDNTASDLPQGNMSGHGVAAGGFHGFTKTFEEHGYVIGIMSVIPKSAYQQGVEKHWRKFSKYDFAWPSLAHLGEQEVKQEEIYYDPNGVAGQGSATFGYQSRYAEYKFKQSSVHGDFRTNLAFWHGGRIFGTEPVLQNEFVKCNNDEFDRVFAVQDATAHKLWCQIYNSVTAKRPLPYYGTPKL